MVSNRIASVLLVSVCVSLAFAASAAPLRVAVLPVVVHSSSGDTDYLSAGLSDMLSSRLEQAGGIDVVELESDARATTKVLVAVEAARSVGAEFVVFGAFTQFGDGASLDLRAARVGPEDEEGEPETRDVFIQSGTLGSIIPRLDDVAGRVVHFVRGQTGAPAAPAGGGEATAAEGAGDLEQRVQALEREVFSKPADGAAEAPAGAE